MSFIITVIGAGHAGLEAAFIVSKFNIRVNLLVLDINHLGSCPCNPSIGGPAKGIVTREIDVLGGMQAIAADNNALQYKLLNSSKGPAVQAIRAQIDKIGYKNWFQSQVKLNKNINLIQSEAINLIVRNEKIKGVILKDGSELLSDAVIITTGTYLRSKTYCGNTVKNQGPDQSKNSEKLSTNLINRGFKTIRLKTGTPPRILKTSLDYNQMELEINNNQNLAFSTTNKNFLPLEKQIPCYLVHTNQKIHDLILKNLKKSAMFNGSISAQGPLYCPSIEDKVFKFSQKPRHQIFVEPESLSLDTIYLAGLSTSFTPEIQKEIIQLLPGFQNAEIKKFGYAIEYDAFLSNQLKPTLETKLIGNLYFAGQINGTSGYEEAAGQGLMAGINAALKLLKKPPFILQRNEAYIGVMINDLVTKTISDPYRLLTSRAEYRLWLRNDNVQERLIKKSFELGLTDKKTYELFLKKEKKKQELISFLKNTQVGKVKALKFTNKNTAQSLYDFNKRSEINLDKLIKDLPEKYQLDSETLKQIEIEIKYEGYIKKNEKYFKGLDKLSKIKIPHTFDYHKVKNLASEAIFKLSNFKPSNLAIASQIAGVNFNDIIAIKHFLKTYE